MTPAPGACVTPAHCLGAQGQAQNFPSEVLPRGDKSPLFMSSSVPRNGMIDSRPGSLSSRACPMPLAGGKVTGHPEENRRLRKQHSCAGGPPAGPSPLPQLRAGRSPKTPLLTRPCRQTLMLNVSLVFTLHLIVDSVCLDFFSFF